MNYSPELKEALLRRMLPPNNESITKIAREEGLSEQTLRNWRDKARKDGYAAPGTDAVPDDWSTQDKFLVVVETAGLNESELAEYARKKGLYVEQIQAWKDHHSILIAEKDHMVPGFVYIPVFRLVTI